MTIQKAMCDMACFDCYGFWIVGDLFFDIPGELRFASGTWVLEELLK